MCVEVPFVPSTAHHFEYAAASMRVSLHRMSPPEKAGLVGEYTTNTNGWLVSAETQDQEKILEGESTVGVYTLQFFVSDYYAAKGGKPTYTSARPFMGEVPLRFGIDNPDEEMRLSLHVSPWSLEMLKT